MRFYCDSSTLTPQSFFFNKRNNNNISHRASTRSRTQFHLLTFIHLMRNNEPATWAAPHLFQRHQIKYSKIAQSFLFQEQWQIFKAKFQISFQKYKIWRFRNWYTIRTYHLCNPSSSHGKKLQKKKKKNKILALTGKITLKIYFINKQVLDLHL